MAVRLVSGKLIHRDMPLDSKIISNANGDGRLSFNWFTRLSAGLARVVYRPKDSLLNCQVNCRYGNCH